LGFAASFAFAGAGRLFAASAGLRATDFACETGFERAAGRVFTAALRFAGTVARGLARGLSRFAMVSRPRGVIAECLKKSLRL
jgi:hypothetical protein